MNKGLEALGRITSTQNITMYEQNECLKTIEQDLKAYEELESMHEELAKAYNKLCQEKLEWLKQKQALEIIKRDIIDVINLIDTYDTYEEMIQDYYAYGDEESIIKSKEEFDLLKEVLL